MFVYNKKGGVYISIICGIYKISNKNNNKVYIGQSVNIKNRWNYYNYPLPDKYKYQLIHSEILKSKGDFFFEVIEECKEAELNEREAYWISHYNSYENGYNQTPGGDFENRGEANGRAILKEEDIYFMRERYRNRESKKETFERFFKDRGITWRGFEKAWLGENWSHIEPETFEKKSEYYSTKAKARKGQQNGNAILSDEEVVSLRERYVNESAKEIYVGLENVLAFSTLKNILEGSSYKHLPVYKKREKRWINK